MDSEWPTDGVIVFNGVLPPKALALMALPELRYLAYHEIMQEANLAEDIIVTPEEPELKAETRAITYEIVQKYVAKNGCPNAIFRFNDERAIATLPLCAT